MKKRIAIVVVILLVAGLGYVAWRIWGPSSTGGQSALSGSGTIEASQIVVSPLVAGRIVDAPAAEGATVETGQVLFRIDPEIYDLQVKQAYAGISAAKAARDQAKRDDKSTAEISAAQTQLDQARLAAKMAELQVSYCTVVSPASGTILSVAADAGENAAPGQTLATLGLVDRLTVSVFIPESRIGQVKVGDKARLTTDSTAKAFECTVVFIATEAQFTPATVETQDQRVKLVYEVKLDVSDPSGSLKPGMPADVVFE